MTTLSFLRLRWLGGKKVWASVTLATCVWAGHPSYRPVATRASHSIRAPSRPPAATPQTGVWETPTRGAAWLPHDPNQPAGSRVQWMLARPPSGHLVTAPRASVRELLLPPASSTDRYVGSCAAACSSRHNWSRSSTGCPPAGSKRVVHSSGHPCVSSVAMCCAEPTGDHHCREAQRLCKPG